MITTDKIVRTLYGMWICELRKGEDPDYELKVETIKEVMNRFGVEGMEEFDAVIEDLWKRHFLHLSPSVWKK